MHNAAQLVDHRGGRFGPPLRYEFETTWRWQVAAKKIGNATKSSRSCEKRVTMERPAAGRTGSALLQPWLWSSGSFDAFIPCSKRKFPWRCAGHLVESLTMQKYSMKSFSAELIEQTLIACSSCWSIPVAPCALCRRGLLVGAIRQGVL
eukprot:9502684-Pyramimonas_sp.AAC.1